MEEEKFVKIVVVGDGKFIYKTKKNLFFFSIKGRVGKTCITLKYVKNTFDPKEESTINADFL